MSADDMLSFTQLFNVSSVGALMLAYASELFFWVKTQTIVTAQAS